MVHEQVEVLASDLFGERLENFVDPIAAERLVCPSLWLPEYVDPLVILVLLARVNVAFFL